MLSKLKNIILTLFSPINPLLILLKFVALSFSPNKSPGHEEKTSRIVSDKFCDEESLKVLSHVKLKLKLF